MVNDNCSILVGRKAICNYLKIGKHEFYEFVKVGMPIKKIGKRRKRWIGHCDQLEEWGKEVSKK